MGAEDEAEGKAKGGGCHVAMNLSIDFIVFCNAFIDSSRLSILSSLGDST